MKNGLKKIVLFGIAVLVTGVILLLANAQGERKYEHDIVFLGDSVIGNHAEPFGVTSVMEERLGLDVFNGALGGTCMSFYTGDVF